MGKYLNDLIFAEAQLQLRYSNLIILQDNYKSKIDELRLEFNELKAKFQDSTFIENWNSKYLKDFTYLPHGRDVENYIIEKSLKLKNFQNIERLGIVALKIILDFQCHMNKLVEEVNANCINENYSKVKSLNDASVFRKRTLSFRNSFGTLPVIKEQYGNSSFYLFNETVKKLMVEKFHEVDNSKCELLCTILNNDYILKNFLISNDLLLYFSDSESPEDAVSKLYLLYTPAHENLRRKISKGIKAILSFLHGIVQTSEQIMNDFDQNKLTELQIDKLMAVNPNLHYSSRHLRDIIFSVLNHKTESIPNSKNKKISKFIKSTKVEIEPINEDIDEEESSRFLKTIQVKSHKKTRSLTQREIKGHLKEINSLLIKSSRRIIK